MRAIPILVVLSALAGCGNPLELDTDQLTLQVRSETGNLPDDPLTITGARVVGARLELDLQYAGGCRDHRFAVVAGRDFGESLPPFTVLRVAHDAQGDGCEVLVTRSIEVDLSPVEPFLPQGSKSLRFELVEPGEKLSKVGERRVDF